MQLWFKQNFTQFNSYSFNVVSVFIYARVVFESVNISWCKESEAFVNLLHEWLGINVTVSHSLRTSDQLMLFSLRGIWELQVLLSSSTDWLHV